MLHAHIKHHVHSIYCRVQCEKVLHYKLPAEGIDGQQWSPRGDGRAVAGYCTSNNFMLFKGLGFPSLHHKFHYNSRLFSWKECNSVFETTHNGVGGCVSSLTMCGCVKKKNPTTSSFLSKSHILHALNASWLQVPLGIASLMNANGKGLLLW